MSNITDDKLPLVMAQSWISRSAGGAGKVGASRHPRVRIAAAHHEWNHMVVSLIALRKGFWSDEGLNDVEVITLESEAASLEGLSHGTMDFAVDPASPYVVKAIYEGSDIFIVAPRRGTHAFYLFGQKGMRTVKDLKGGHINIFTPGDEMMVQTAQVVRDAGMVPDVDVKVTLYDGDMHDVPGMEEAFRKGKAQGLLATDIQAVGLKADGFPLLVNLQEAYLPRQDRVMVASGNMVKNHPDTVKAFLKGIIKGNRFFLDKQNREEITAIVRESGFAYAIENKRMFDIIFDSLYTRIPANCDLPLESIEQLIKEQIAAGQIDDKITVDGIVRLGPLQKAQKELGAR